MQITHFGHSCLLIQAGGARILIDPGCYSQGWAGLDDLDAILVTHRHRDHVDPVLLPARLTAQPELAAHVEPGVLEELILPTSTAMVPGDRLQFGQLSVDVVGGAHALIHPDIPQVGNVGLLVRAPGEPSVFHPGDALDVTPQSVDVLCVPMYAPWAKVSQTIDFVRAVTPRYTIPIHDGLLNDDGFELIAGHLIERTSGRFVPVRDQRPWTVTTAVTL